MAHSEDIRAHVRRYMMVFGALMVLTVLTVAVSYLHLPLALAVTVALTVAIVKGSLVAGFFMHLIDERRLIYYVLAGTVVFFFVLLFWPTLEDFAGIQHDAPAVEVHGTESVSPPVH